MIIKIRRKRIVVKQKEVFTVKKGNEQTQICPICRTTFATQTLSVREQKQLSSAEISDKMENEL